MKTFTIATLAVLVSANVFAADTIPLYEGKDLNKTPATLADVLYSETEQQQDIHGNTLAIGHLNNVKADKTEVQAVSNRVTQNTNTINQQSVQIQANTKETVRLEQVKADRSELKAVEGVVVNQGNTLTQHNKTLVNHRGRIETLEGASNEYGARLDAYEASYNDLSSTVANYNTRLHSVEKNVKEAKESAAIALAVAGHQFNTDPEAGFQMALSGATTGGEQAIALGAGGAINRNWFVNAGVSKSGSTSGAVVSATYSFR